MDHLSMPAVHEAGNISMSVSCTAIHEAGHAVVAAYLRVPFAHVTIKPGKIKPGKSDGGYYLGYVRTTGKPVNLRKYSESQVKRLTNQVIVFLAGRAADEMLMEEQSEKTYESDEENVKRFAEWLADRPFNTTDNEFQAWRASLSLRAREIVAIPYIRDAVMVVALKLELAYKDKKKGLPAKEVRHVLRWVEKCYKDTAHRSEQPLQIETRAQEPLTA